jgi:hypothetical protein
VRLGTTFRVGDLAMASGYLWAYPAAGTPPQPVVSEVSPVTLARIRSIPLPSAPASFGLPVAFTTGPKDSVWIGYYRTLLRVDAATGRTLARVTLPRGLAAGNDAVAASGTTLYASATHVAKDGGMVGLVMLEYDARSGRRLAEASGGLIRDSVAGASLTAVPGGVWASFRTGMMGLTVHLGANALPMITPPGRHIALTPANGLFHWAMSGETIYGGGALWLANEGGWLACLNPRTGHVRAAERIPLSRGPIDPLAVYRARHQVIAAGDQGLVEVTPPKRCWH